VVVIPVLGELLALPATLESLAANPGNQRRNTLVLCVVNNREAGHARAEDIAQNAETLAWLQRYVPGRIDGLHVAVIDASSEGRTLGQKQGVGTARKLGMDRALSLLAQAGGIIVSLDADTRVEANYLASIQRQFREVGQSAAVIAYAHDFPAAEGLREAVVSYELYLRYHELGLCFAGSPYAFHTIGSATACTAGAYAAAGGMNQREAGEDFYFLQELAKTGRVSRITDTTVRPSARASHRVPFGTGAYIAKHLDGPGHTTHLYHPDAYLALRTWLCCVQTKGDLPAEELIAHYCRIIKQDNGIQDPGDAAAKFLGRCGFEKTWPKLQAGAGTPAQLLAQFHRWFDALKTLRFVHALRDTCLPSVPRSIAFRSLLARISGEEFPNADASLDALPHAREAFLIRLRTQHEDLRQRLESLQ